MDRNLANFFGGIAPMRPLRIGDGLPELEFRPCIKG
jgi:hypothetical protein